MTDDKLLATLEAAKKATPGPLWSPHFVRDDHSCECRMILGEHGPMGGIAQIQVNNGLPVGEGGNDAPPLEEAKANAEHIANCDPQTIIALIESALDKDTVRVPVDEDAIEAAY